MGLKPHVCHARGAPTEDTPGHGTIRNQISFPIICLKTRTKKTIGKETISKLYGKKRSSDCITKQKQFTVLKNRMSRRVTSTSQYLDILPADSFSNRWAGYIGSRIASVYTFHVNMLGVHEKTSLWINNVFILDQWISLFSPAMSGTVFF